MGNYREVKTILVLVDDTRRYAVPKIDLSMGEVDIGGVTVVSQDIAFESKPVAVVLGISLAAF